MSWLTAPAGGASAVGVVIVPPVGYEYWSSHIGHCGPWPSAWPGRAAARCGSTSTAPGTRPVTSGIRHGCRPGRAGSVMRPTPCAGGGSRRWSSSDCASAARLPSCRASALRADAVVAWAPVVRGRRYVSELQLLGLPVPEAPGAPERSGGVVQAGSVFSAETLADLGAIDLATLADRPAPKVLLVDRDDKPASASLLERLRALGVEPDHVVAPGDGSGARSAHRVRHGGR